MATCVWYEDVRARTIIFRTLGERARSEKTIFVENILEDRTCSEQ